MVGVGGEKQLADSPSCTPPRKIRARFHGCKHTSLTYVVGESGRLGRASLLDSESDRRNVCRNAWQTVVLYSGVVTEGASEQDQGVSQIGHPTVACLAWPLWALIVAGICLGFLLWPVSEVALIPLVLSTALPFATVGALVASRRPHNPVGWLFIAFAAAATLRFTGSQYATYTLLKHPGSLPAGDLIASFAIHLWHPALGFLKFSFLLFPHGRLLSPRWRIVAWVSAISCVTVLISGMLEYEFLYEYTWPENMSFVKPLFTGSLAEVAATVFWYSLMVILAMLFVSAGSLVLRLRRIGR